MRDALVKAIADRHADAGTAVQDLMVVWEDIPTVADRSLQEALRQVDAGRLALALVGAPPRIAHKIRGNISERARSRIDEETSLMREPEDEEIDQAREEVLGYLRQLNADGQLKFEEH
jgi:flagellar motor switch protein FliG